MHRSSTSSGELEVKKRGQDLKSSLRHSTFPVAASRQDRVPRTPRVTTFPPATAGEHRAPGKEAAGPDAPPASYLSDQTSLPSVALRQRRTSWPLPRVKTNSRSPTRAGVATPSPTVTFHFSVSSLGQVAGAVNPITLPSRWGPRHWGQSWAH